MAMNKKPEEVGVKLDLADRQLLVNLVQNKPCLYNKDSPGCKNAREKAWQDIHLIMGKHGTDGQYQNTT